ncbi:hypothetical protein [Fodinicola acaciae]|uniref:hypothetical protein n=1 Tax=Fodinicola acaciae TaxID=2681555 RepID=UPI0013D708FD|nr:hypothetical protein [Fodinicola acaciae]
MVNDDDSGKWRAYAETGLILVGLVGLGFLMPHNVLGDALARYKALDQFIHTGVLNDDPHPIIGHLFSLPAYLLNNPKPVVEQYNLVLFAVALGWTYWLLRDRVDPALTRRFFLVLIVGSMFPAHLSQYNSEPLTALAVGVGLMAVAMRAHGGWTAIAIGVANTPAALGGLALVVLRKIWQDRRLRYVLVGVAAVALIALENWVRRGSPLDSGYNGLAGFKTVMPYSGLPGFSYPFLFGLLSIMLSFGKGLVFFAPGILLPVRSLLRRAGLWDAYALWLLFLAGLVIAYAKWWSWNGGFTWGPRFFLFAAIPASLAVAALLWRPSERLWLNLFALVVWGLSTWVGICAAVYFDARDLTVCKSHNFQLEVLCNYTPDFSVLWYPLVRHLPAHWYGALWILFSAIVFAYLAMPLIARTLSQLNAALARLIHSARSTRWRF